MIKFLLLFLSCGILIYGTDASFIYHAIRGQDSIKLVVIYGAFEVRLLLPAFTLAYSKDCKG